MAATSLPMSACVNKLEQEDTQQKIKKNVNVILIVDTVNIKPDDVNQYCHFSGQRSDTPIQDFTIYPNVGDTVTWLGLSGSTSDDVVHIKEINYKIGNEVFDEKRLEGKAKPKGAPMKVTGKIKHKTIGIALEDKFGQKNNIYNIVFTINDNDDTEYNIDPKIQVNQ